MFHIAKFYPDKIKHLDAATYLERAYRTAVAYWTVPMRAFAPELVRALSASDPFLSIQAVPEKARPVASDPATRASPREFTLSVPQPARPSLDSPSPTPAPCRSKT